MCWLVTNYNAALRVYEVGFGYVTLFFFILLYCVRNSYWSGDNSTFITRSLKVGKIV